MTKNRNNIVSLTPGKMLWGSRNGTVVRVFTSHHCGLGLIPGLVLMGVEFVVGSCPSSKRFFFWYSRFFLSSKTNISKFQFDLESVPILKSAFDHLVMELCSIQIFKFVKCN